MGQSDDWRDRESLRLQCLIEIDSTAAGRRVWVEQDQLIQFPLLIESETTMPLIFSSSCAVGHILPTVSAGSQASRQERFFLVFGSFNSPPPSLGAICVCYSIVVFDWHPSWRRRAVAWRTPNSALVNQCSSSDFSRISAAVRGPLFSLGENPFCIKTKRRCSMSRKASLRPYRF